MDLRLPEWMEQRPAAPSGSQSPSPRVIVQTTHEGDEDIHQALQAGAIANNPAAGAEFTSRRTLQGSTP